MDDEIEIDSHRAALEQVIDVLTPLRQHRQASAERAQREAQVQLESLHQQLQQTRAAYTQEREYQRERRQGLSEANLNKSLSLNDVDRWHEKEKRMLDQLAYIRQNVLTQRLDIDQQQLHLQQAQAAARASQRAVEKLSCLREALNEEG
jgi:hypothetical protein